MRLGGELGKTEWKDLRKQRDEAINQWVENATLKTCPECGQAYSYGYFPVWEDPGACQACRDAEGDLLY